MSIIKGGLLDRRGFLKTTAATAIAASLPMSAAIAAPKRGGHLRVGKGHGQFARRQFRLLQSKVDKLALYLVGHSVPDVFWLGRLILQPSLTSLQVPIIPTVECGAGDAQFGQRKTGR